jgi:hypothetical protein
LGMTDDTVGANCQVTIGVNVYSGTFEWHSVAENKYIIVCEVTP